MKVVPGYGPKPNSVMLIGEGPGAEEYRIGRPFVGKSGQEQRWYLSRYNLSPDNWYLTNIIKEYTDGNPDPTIEQIKYWTPTLLQEISDCNPKLIIAVGRFAIRFFLGEDAELDICHGLPHRVGAFDSNRINRAPKDCIILPVIHPASGFYDNSARVLISYDYSQVANIIDKLNNNELDTVEFRVDEYKGNEQYIDVTGAELDHYLNSSFYQDIDPVTNRAIIPEIGIDTEGTPDDPWSIQISTTPGTAYVLRYTQPDFSIGISALQQLADNSSGNGTLFIMHCANTPMGTMYDIIMCRVMGLDLSRARVWDTMYALYLLRIEPKGLKPASYRWCGTLQDDYMSLIGDIGKRKQESYLIDVLTHEWPDVESRVKSLNDGTIKLTKPRHIIKLVEGILKDLYSGKVNKDGEETDPFKRWMKIDPVQRKLVEGKLGKMPIGTLNDIPIEQAVMYAGRDSDITLRLKHKLQLELARLDLIDMFTEDMEILPLYYEMQSHGMPASRSKFERFHSILSDKLSTIQSELSINYFGEQPFNPKSPVQVRSLLLRRGLASAKRTASNLPSTGKKSIEHLRFQDPAIELVFQWREHQHLRDSFVETILELIPDNYEPDIYDITCVFKTNTETRRLATENPNLLAIPSRTELGKLIRDCYICRENELMGAWDFSQVEARFMAHESRDELLCKFFIEGRDIHTETAMLMFGVKREDVTKRQRRDAKDINFGVLYGIQASGLYDQFRMRGIESNIEYCDKLIKEWYKIYKGVKVYQQEVIMETERKGYIRDHWGMYRYLPNIYALKNKKFSNNQERREAESLRAEAERHAVSHKIQGGACGMLRQSIRHLKPIIHSMVDMGMNVKPRLPIHDELVFTFETGIEQLVNDIVIDSLVNHCGIKLIVPVEAEGKIGKTWSELK